MKKIKTLPDDQQILVYSGCLATAVFILIIIGCLVFKKSLIYSLGFLLCYGVGVIGFLKSNYVIDRILCGDYLKPKRSMVFNSITNNILYCIVLLINFYFSCFNIFVGAIGLLIIKTVVIIRYGIFQK